MKWLIPVLLSVVSAFAAKDSLPILRINTQIEGAWDLGDAFQHDLESSLRDLRLFTVPPESERAAFLVTAHADPFLRDSSDQALLEAKYPHDLTLDLQIRPPILESGRRTGFFFLGQRRTGMHATMHFYAQSKNIMELNGELDADTSVAMGYCGILDCIVEPISAQQRLQIEASLFANLIQQINARLKNLLKIPADYVAKRDSLDNELRKPISLSLQSSQAASSANAKSSSSKK